MIARARFWLVLVALLGALSCRSKDKAAPGNAGWTGIAFVEDDYERALGRAKAERRLLFVDAWAPWCHNCLSMKSYVFTDPALMPLASRFVWAAVDTEKKQSEPFLRKFPMKNWPTLWVVDPASEKVVLKWAGALTASELATLLDAATQEKSAAAPGAAEATVAWMRGNHYAAEGDRAGAVAAYQEALARAPKRWALRAGIAEALTSQLQAGNERLDCFHLATSEMPNLLPGTSRVNVLLAGLDCAESLAEGSQDLPSARSLAELGARIAADAAEPILADDRSSLYEGLVAFYRNDGARYRQPGDEALALALARQWRDFLDGEAARAPTARARAVFDSHRILAYEAVGETARAIPMLEQSERDFPDDYNPPARLAKVYLDLGRLDEALTAVRRAETRVYGPRSLRIMSTEADILVAMKKPKDAKDALARAVALGEKLELTPGYRNLLGELRNRAASM